MNQIPSPHNHHHYYWAIWCSSGSVTSMTATCWSVHPMIPLFVMNGKILLKRRLCQLLENLSGLSRQWTLHGFCYHLKEALSSFHHQLYDFKAIFPCAVWWSRRSWARMWGHKWYSQLSCMPILYTLFYPCIDYRHQMYHLNVHGKTLHRNKLFHNDWRSRLWHRSLHQTQVSARNWTSSTILGQTVT